MQVAFAAMLANVNKTGIAQAQADVNMSAFGERLKAITNSFYNVTTATNSDNKALAMLGKTMDYVSDHMDVIVGVGATLLGMFGTMKALIWGTQAAIVGYNVVLGLNAGFSKVASIAVGKNTIALGAYKVAQTISTGATWLATTATSAFAGATLAATWPILAIIGAVAAVIAIFYYWDDITAWFSKQWATFTNWIGEAWQNVVKWFKEFDFMKFFKDIGQSILKFVLTPMTSMLKLISGTPGMLGDMANKALTTLGDLTGDGEIAVRNRMEPIDGPEVKMAQSNQDIKNAILSGSLNVNFNDPGNMVKSTIGR